MAYFDSSKNRALWEIRLGQLKKERAAREAGGTNEALKEQAVNEKSAVRVPISYQELLKREAEESGKKRERAAKDTAKERTQARERQAERQAQA